MGARGERTELDESTVEYNHRSQCNERGPREGGLSVKDEGAGVPLSDECRGRC